MIVKKGESFDYAIGNIQSARGEAYIASSTANANPVVTGENNVNVEYRTHVQSFGWQGWKYNGVMSGTSGKAKRLEGINIKLTNKPYSGSIVYTTHVQSIGWQGNENNVNTWFRDGQMAGTSGRATYITVYMHRPTAGLPGRRTAKLPEPQDSASVSRVSRSCLYRRAVLHRRTITVVL